MSEDGRTSPLPPLRKGEKVDGASRRQDWDVVVIGAGPAGATAALLLARKSLNVLLVESRAFPRDKVCGGCLNAAVLRLLGRAGLGSLCDDLGAPETNRLRIRRAGRWVDVSTPPGRAASRRAFDQALVQSAVDSGAAFLANTRAVVAADALDRIREVRLHEPQGERTVAARIILAADGLAHSSVAELSEFSSVVQRKARLGIGATIDGDGWSEPPCVISMAVGRRGYVGAVRVEGGRLNIAAAVDASELSDQSPSDAVATILDEAGSPLKLPSDAVWRGTPPLTRTAQRLHAERVLLLGDASGYIEPFTGEGIGWAMASAFRVVPLAVAARHSWSDDLGDEWERRQRTFLNKSQRNCRRVAALLRRPFLSGVVMSAIATFPSVGEFAARRLDRTSELLETTE